MAMKYLVFPGQGSQKPGFLEPWVVNDAFKSIVESHSETIGMDLIHMGTKASQEEIAQTSVTQPLIVSASIASARTVFSEKQLASFDAMAGHSVGEFALAALAGIITDEQAMKLVSLRANAMQKAADENATGMAAAIGSDLGELKSKLGNLEIANYNGANQYVIAGAQSDLEKIKEHPPTGFRIIPLAVTGAFHTGYMDPAKQELASHFEEIEAKDPKVKVLSNRDGQEVASGEEFMQSLLKQVSSPVRWDKCMETINGAQIVVEAAPSGVLSNLLKKSIDDAQIYSLKTSDDSIDLGLND
ncbi:MAG: ACP S-malonyltransferase [Microbacteriaceae bacterium]|nr:ACP S-malonyltransferase [Microbacteriaceae bacterium]